MQQHISFPTSKLPKYIRTSHNEVDKTQFPLGFNRLDQTFPDYLVTQLERKKSFCIYIHDKSQLTYRPCQCYDFKRLIFVPLFYLFYSPSLSVVSATHQWDLSEIMIQTENTTAHKKYFSQRKQLWHLYVKRRRRAQDCLDNQDEQK